MSSDASSPAVLFWWSALSAVSLVNLAAWAWVVRRQARDRATETPAERRERRWLLALSTIFVFGCAYRSFLPRAEGQRICLYDSWWSSVILSRAVATVAELSLVGQWSLVLRRWSRPSGFAAGEAISRVMLPMIGFAEICSWYTTLTTNFLGSVMEESTWAVTGTLLVGALVGLWVRVRPARRLFIGASILLNAAYVVFMWSVDVPMYLGRYRADTVRGKSYLTVADGFRDAALRRVVTRRWEDWRHEIPWMSLYFSVGVWISLSLVRAPRLGAERD